MAKKEKKSVVGLRPTTSYAPVRGQNQDYGGVGVKNDNADYTISDEHDHKIKPWTPAHAPEWEVETPKTRKDLANQLVKDTDPNRGKKMKKSLREVAERRTLAEIKEMIGFVFEAKDDDKEDDDDKESEPNRGSPSADDYKKMSRSDQVGARMQHDNDHGLTPQGGAAVGDDEVDDLHKREYDSKTASGHGHLINPKNPYNTPGYTGPKDSYGKSKADWAKEAAERRKHIEDHGMDSFNKKYGYLPGSPRHQTFGDDDKEFEKKINRHNMLKANGMKSPYDNESPVKEEHINEARGRPKKDSASDSPDTHPIQQARQVISTRGMHPFTFANGKRAQMNPMTAHRILAHHDNLQTPSEKEAFASRVHKDVDSLHSWLAGKPHEEELPKISLGGSSKVGGIADRSRPTISGVKPGKKK